MIAGNAMRRIAAAALLLFATLLIVAVVPVLWQAGTVSSGSVSSGPNAPGPNFSGPVGAVLALQSGAVDITRPVKLSQSPDITLTRGRVAMRGSSSGSGAAQTLSLHHAVFDLVVAGWQPVLQSGADPVQPVFEPLVQALATLSADRVVLKTARLRLIWGSGPAQALVLEAFDADIALRNRRLASMQGAFVYLNNVYNFETRLDERVQQAVLGPGPVTTSVQPLKIMVRSEIGQFAIDGVARFGATVAFDGTGDFRAIDSGRLAQALGLTWTGQPGGLALSLKGALRWADGIVSFSRTEFMVGDQFGTGAAALSSRDGRPRLEAAIAFPSLDVAPLLQRGGSQIDQIQTPSAPWRSLATSFPAAAVLDADLRVSAERLQWKGAPVGQGAVTVSAAGGSIHGDFAELRLGNHRGALQFAIDHRLAGTPVALRGRFESADIGDALMQGVGVAPFRGRATIQFDLAGRGSTLGEVLDHARGTAAVNGLEGEMLFDLAGLQRQMPALAQSGALISQTGIAQRATVDMLNARMALRPGGVVMVEAADVFSKGLHASVTGSIGIAAETIDLRGKLQVGAVPTATNKRPQVASGAVPMVRDGFALRGPWAAPRLTAVAPEQPP